jgi:hypothetical protein
MAWGFQMRAFWIIGAWILLSIPASFIFERMISYGNGE